MKIWLKNLDINNPKVLAQISQNWTKQFTTYSTVFFSSKGLINLKDNKLFPLTPTFQRNKEIETEHIICDPIEWKMHKEIYQLPSQHIMASIKKILYEKGDFKYNLIVEYLNEMLHDIYFIPKKIDTSIDNFTLCVSDFD
jgi:hypothetical protein